MSTLNVEFLKQENSSSNNVTLDSDGSVAINRHTSDGTIIDLQKDGSAVGSIGTQGGDLWVGTGDTGAYFWDGSNAIAPWNPSTNITRDAAINLGTSGVRFKDLYLSGGVYLGGTGAANYLDDYETGTWTPSFSTVYAGPTVGGSATSSGTYVKNGDQVTCYFVYNFEDGGTNFAVDHRWAMGGLPFTPAQSTLSGAGNFWVYSAVGAGNNAFGVVSTDTSTSTYWYVTHLDGTVGYVTNIRGFITFSV